MICLKFDLVDYTIIILIFIIDGNGVDWIQSLFSLILWIFIAPKRDIYSAFIYHVYLRNLI